jgi:addiction module RelB/DinJ family antitoxin
MPATARVNFLTDPSTKKRAEQVFDRMGINMSSGLNLYLTHVALYGSIPFNIELPGGGRNIKKK